MKKVLQCLPRLLTGIMQGWHAPVHRGALGIPVLLAMLLPTPALAEAGRVRVEGARLVALPDALVLSADFTIRPGEILSDALGRGLALPFLLEFRLLRPRSWWLDATVVRLDQRWEVSWDELTRRCVLVGVASIESFDDCSAALAALGRRRLVLYADEPLQAGRDYRAELRLSLDRRSLPQPLQVEAIGASGWKLDSGWHEFGFRMP